MKIFNKKNIPIRAAVYSFILILLICISAYALNENAFSHTEHIEESECSVCHFSGDKKEPVLPEKQTCIECHDNETVEPALPDYTKSKTNQYQFPHKTHKIQTCSTCHKISDGSSPSIPTFNECSGCHKAMEKELSCNQCHEDKFQLPSNHNGVWKRTHGKRTEYGQDIKGHGNDCRVCHGNTACSSCHRVEKPSSHTGFFRIRGHGMKAEIDKKSCAVCHQESSCVRCHKETRPLNHKGTWRNTHGLTIPGGLSGNSVNCNQCHTNAWCAGCH